MEDVLIQRQPQWLTTFIAGNKQNMLCNNCRSLKVTSMLSWAWAWHLSAPACSILCLLLWIFVNEMTRMAQFIRTLIFFLSIVSGNYIEPALMFNWVEFGCEHLINIIFRGGIFHFVLLQPSSIFCKPMLISCYRLSEPP